MKKLDNIRVYAWLEFVLWLIIVAVGVLGIRYHYYQTQKQYKSYQIFMEDVDGLIVGSPVKFLGVQIGHVKKIQIIASNVYIKFIITQKGLQLPAGSIATVEASGLGGSKALEIYPPAKGATADKLIMIKEPTRLGKVMSLFDDIFKELNAIFMTVDHAGSQIDMQNGIPKNIVEPADIKEGLIKIESRIDAIHNAQQKIKDNFNGENKENRGKNESEQCENNQ